MQEDALQDVLHARSMLRWMRCGVTPSAGNMQRVERAFVRPEVTELVDDASRKNVLRITRAIGMGVAASTEKCAEALNVVDQVLERLRDAEAQTAQDRMTMRPRFQ